MKLNTNFTQWLRGLMPFISRHLEDMGPAVLYGFPVYVGFITFG